MLRKGQKAPRPNYRAPGVMSPASASASSPSAPQSFGPGGAGALGANRVGQPQQAPGDNPVQFKSPGPITYIPGTESMVPDPNLTPKQNLKPGVRPKGNSQSLSQLYQSRYGKGYQPAGKGFDSNGRSLFGQSFYNSPGPDGRNGSDPATNPTLQLFNDPSRFSGQSRWAWPTYGSGPTGDMPVIQRAFASGEQNAGITQLLPNVNQTSTTSQQPNAFGLSDPTANVGPIQSSQLSRVTVGQNGGLTPGEALNVSRESENQLAAQNAYQQQQALDTVVGGQQNVRSLYGQAQGQLGAIGNQAYGRIGEQLQNNLSSSQGDLEARGLGNSTVTDTVGHLFRREATDANLGVDEMRAKAAMGLDTQLADTEGNAAGEEASILGSNGESDPATYLLPGMIQAKAGGGMNYGQIAGPVGGIVGGIFGGGAGAAIGSSIGNSAGNMASKKSYQSSGGNSFKLTGLFGGGSGGGAPDTSSGGDF